MDRPTSSRSESNRGQGRGRAEVARARGHPDFPSARTGTPPPRPIDVINEDAQPRSASGAERLQLTNLLEEQSQILRLGFEESMWMQVHLDGTQSGDAITGLDGLITLTPTSGTVSRVDNVWWCNHAPRASP